MCNSCCSISALVVHDGTHPLVGVVVTPEHQINFLGKKTLVSLSIVSPLYYYDAKKLIETIINGISFLQKQYYAESSISHKTDISPSGSVSFVLSTYIGLKYIHAYSYNTVLTEKIIPTSRHLHLSIKTCFNGKWHLH